MDLITHLPPTVRGHTVIAVFLDRVTKMLNLASSYDTLTTVGFADLLLTEVFRRHGLRESIYQRSKLEVQVSFLQHRQQPSWHQSEHVQCFPC